MLLLLMVDYRALYVCVDMHGMPAARLLCAADATIPSSCMPQLAPPLPSKPPPSLLLLSSLPEALQAACCDSTQPR